MLDELFVKNYENVKQSVSGDSSTALNYGHSFATLHKQHPSVSSSRLGWSGRNHAFIPLSVSHRSTIVVGDAALVGLLFASV